MSQALMDELVAEFWATGGVMTFSRVAMQQFAERFPIEPTRENPDPTVFLGQGDPNDPEVQADASWTKSRIESAAHEDGWMQQWLTQAWVTLVFARWEGYYRPAFAREHGVEARAVRSNVIGDLRHLRNDIVHHAGVATAGNTGKCTIVRHLALGAPITLKPENIRMLRAALTVEIDVRST